MTGGLVQLVVHGRENMVLTDNPSITFFKRVYKRHSNFSIEPIPQKFNVKPNFGERVTCTLSKQGDMLSNIHLVVDLPAFALADPLIKVRWVDYVGLALIKTVELEIGGKVVDRQCGDVMNILRLLQRDNHTAGLDKMLGHVPELLEFSDTKSTYTLYIPLMFWFCRYSNMALPLVALEHSEVKVNVEFQSLDALIVYSPTHYVTAQERTVSIPRGTRLTQGTAVAAFESFDILTQRLYYRTLNGAPLAPGIITATTGHTVTATGAQAQYRSKNYVYDNIVTFTLSGAFLLADYVYIDNKERAALYYKPEHEFLIDYVQWDNDKILTNTVNKIKLGYSNPVKALYARVQVDAVALGLAKDPFNYYADALKTRPALQGMRVLLNGMEREAINGPMHYALIQQFQGHVTEGHDSVFVYSWALDPFNSQPSGFCNFTKLDDVVVELQVDQAITYQNVARARIYCLTYNVLKIRNGVASLAFA